MMNQILEKEARYLQIIKESYPSLEVHSARLHTRGGQFNDVLFINENLIFRFPRYEKSINGFLQEIQILQKLQGQVSLPIPDPIYISSGSRSVGKVFMGYRLLPGSPLFRGELNAIRDESTLERFADQLANFLHGLHHIEPAALSLDLPVSDKFSELKRFFADIERHLFPSMREEARDSVTRHFEGYFNNPTLHEYQPSLVHGDFGGSNILFYEGEITGIIDFSFAGLGDPAQDIAAVSTYGELFLARICQHYPGIELLLERASFYRGTFALQEALHGSLNKDKEAFARGMEEYI